MSVDPRRRPTGTPAGGANTRLGAIEDRKIEILMELSRVNREYEARVSALRSEYARLDHEYYHLRLERMRGD